MPPLHSDKHHWTRIRSFWGQENLPRWKQLTSKFLKAEKVAAISFEMRLGSQLVQSHTLALWAAPLRCIVFYFAFLPLLRDGNASGLPAPALMTAHTQLACRQSSEL